VNVTATLIGQMIVFTILILFIKAVLWEPMLNALEERKKRIADGLAAAEKGQQAQAEAQEQAVVELNKAKEDAAEVIAQAQKRAKEIVEEAKNAAIEEANRVKDAANAEIEQETARAREELRGQVAAIAVSGAEKILGREVDAAAHEKALDELAAQI
jgi:F-type H+-transporting ATPase subunit b